MFLLNAESSNIHSTSDLTNNHFLVSPATLADVHPPVEELALTSAAQIRKLELILEELDKRLGPQDGSQIKWNIQRESYKFTGLRQQSNKWTNVRSWQRSLITTGFGAKAWESRVGLDHLSGFMEKIKCANVWMFCFNCLSVDYLLVLGYGSRETVHNHNNCDWEFQSSPGSLVAHFILFFWIIWTLHTITW